MFLPAAGFSIIYQVWENVFPICQSTALVLLRIKEKPYKRNLIFFSRTKNARFLMWLPGCSGVYPPLLLWFIGGNQSGKLNRSFEEYKSHALMHCAAIVTIVMFTSEVSWSSYRITGVVCNGLITILRRGGNCKAKMKLS